MKKLKMTKPDQSIEEKLKIIAENNKALLENAIERGETEIPILQKDGSVKNVSLFEAMCNANDCEKTVEELIEKNPKFKDKNYKG
jgi:hypothetical protein